MSWQDNDARRYTSQSRQRIMQRFDPLADLRPRNQILRKLKQATDDAETAVRNAEEAE